MRHSMGELTPQYSTNRMLREYTEQYYLPLAENWKRRCKNGAREARALLDWHRQIEQYWSAIHFSNFQVLEDKQFYEFKVQLYLDKLDPDFIQVELYADPLNPSESAERHSLQRVEKLIGAVNSYLYMIRIPAQRQINDYTLRVIPQHPQVQIPLECQHILWQQ